LLGGRHGVGRITPAVCRFADYFLVSQDAAGRIDRGGRRNAASELLRPEARVGAAERVEDRKRE
jgi:hypothetical protein